MECFADRLMAQVADLGHPLCVGLDPHLDRIPAAFRQGTMDPLDRQTAPAVEAFLGEVVDRLEGRVAIVKPQCAFFEQLGPRGVAMLARVMARCQQRGLLVLLDAKRGDIGSTAAAYARAYLARDAPMRADALTVAPYLGLETLDPFLDAGREAGGGLFVLVKTSNPGSADLQGMTVDGEAAYLRLARALGPRVQAEVGACGWSSLGVVAGATYPDEARAIRERLPQALFLVPGYGAQGASAADAVAGFVRREGALAGGVVNSSRAILFPGGEGPWESRFDEALGRAIDELASAVT